MKKINNYFLQSKKISSIDDYIVEKLKLNKDTGNKSVKYKYHPKDKNELIDLLLKLLKKRGSNADLNDIDVSKITDMNSLFYEVNRVPAVENIDISSWDVSHVTNMNSMFYKCYNFNCDLSEWDVSNVIDMRHMFEFCRDFNIDYLNDWKLNENAKIEDFIHGCTKGDVPKWYWDHWKKVGK